MFDGRDLYGPSLSMAGEYKFDAYALSGAMLSNKHKLATPRPEGKKD